RLEPPSEVLIEQLNLPPGQGQLIATVFPDSPAMKAGLKRADILLELDGKPVSKVPAELVTALEAIKPDVPVDAVVLRKGAKTTVKGLTLRNAPAPAVLPPVLPQGIPLPPALPGMGQAWPQGIPAAKGGGLAG